MLNEAIMEQILQRENLNAAYRAVKANGGAAGVDGMSISQLKEHVRKHWVTLERKLRAGEYQPAAVRAVEIPKANGGQRTLGIPSFHGKMRWSDDHRQVQPPDAENGTSGGVGGSRCAITVTRPDQRTRCRSFGVWGIGERGTRRL